LTASNYKNIAFFFPKAQANTTDATRKFHYNEILLPLKKE
jgi:hypothetical protein